MKSGRRRRRFIFVLTCLCLIVLFLGAVVFGLFQFNRYQKDRLYAELLEKSKQQIAQGNIDQGHSLLVQCCRLRPDQLESAILLDEIRSDYASTPEELKEVTLASESLLRQHPELHDVRLRQVGKFIALELFNDAFSHLEKLKQTEVADTSQVEVLEGLSLQGLGKYEDAEVALTKAVSRGVGLEEVQVWRQSFDYHDVVEQLAMLYANHVGKPGDGIELLNKELQKTPDDDRLLTIRAKVNDLLNNRNAAYHDLDLAIKSRLKANSIPRVETLNVYLDVMSRSSSPSVDRIQELIGYCEQLTEEGEEDHRFYQNWARLANHLGDPDSAIQALNSGWEQNPDSQILFAFLVDELLANQRVDEAKQLLKSNSDQELLPGVQQYLEGRIAFAEERLDQAKQALAKASIHAASPPLVRTRASLFLGFTHSRLREFSEELPCYQGLDDDQSISGIVTLAKARCLANLNRFDESALQYQLLPPTAYPTVELARVEFERQIAKPSRQRRWKDFDRAIELASESTPDDADVALLKAASFEARGQLESSRKQLVRAAESQPNDLDIWIRLIEFSSEHDDDQTVDSVIADAQKNYGESPRLAVADLPRWERKSKDAALERLAELESLVEDADESDQVFIVERVAGSYRRLAMHEERLRFLKSVVDEVSLSKNLLVQLLGLATEAEDLETLESVRQQLDDGFTDSDPYTQFSAIMLSISAPDSGADDLRKAQDQLAVLAENNPDKTFFPLAQARLSERLGRGLDATEYYLQAFERGSRDPALLRRLLSLLSKQHRFDTIKIIAKQIADYDSQSPEYRLLVSEAGLLGGGNVQFPTAGDGAGEPASADQLLRQASLLLASKRSEDAEALLRDAIVKFPDQGPLWLALIEVVANSGRVEDARQLSSKAQQHSLPQEILGRISEILGDFEQAEKHFILAAKNDPVAGTMVLAEFYVRNNRGSESIPKLEKLLQSPDLLVSEQTRARRLLAVALGATNYSGLKRAFELLDENIGMVLDSTTDKRQKARLLSVYPSPENCSEVIEILTDVESIQPLTVDDSIFLARALDVTGDSKRASERWNLVLNRFELSPDHLKQYIRRQLRTGLIRYVAMPLNRLEASAGIDQETLSFKIRMACLNDDVDQAISVINRLIDSSNNDDAQAEDYRRRMIAAGAIRTACDDRNISSDDRKTLFKRAEEIYRGLLENDPNAAIPYSMLLTSQGLGEKAISTLGAVRGELDELQRVSASVRVIEMCDDLSGESMDQIGQWISEMTSKIRTIQSAMVLESYLRASGKLDQSLALNQKLLKAAPTNVLVLNNYAFLLTERSEFDKAIELTDNAIEIAGPLPFLLDTRAVAKLNHGDFESAIDDLRSAIAQSAIAEQDTGIVRFHLALAYYKSDDVSAAINQLTRIGNDRSSIRRMLPDSEKQDFDKLSEYAELQDI